VSPCWAVGVILTSVTQREQCCPNGSSSCCLMSFSLHRRNSLPACIQDYCTSIQDLRSVCSCVVAYVAERERERERDGDGDGDDDCAADADDCMLCVCVVKAITFGRHPESILHNYFTSFLSRLTHGCHGSKKTEVES